MSANVIVQTMSARRCALVAWCGCVWALWCAPASAISPDLEVWQLYHTSWTARDGAPTGIVSITQTLDGYLWLATATGLFRFDGVRFERFDGASGVRLPSSNVFSLFATPSGDLWIGYMFGGVSVVRNGHITNYTERDGLPTASVRAIAQDPTGATWVATSLADVGSMRAEIGTDRIREPPPSPWTVRGRCGR